MFKGNSYTPERLDIAQEFQGKGQAIYFDVRLQALTPPDGQPETVDLGRDYAPGGVCFSVLVCRDGQVEAAAEPYWLVNGSSVVYSGGNNYRNLIQCFPSLPIVPRKSEENSKGLFARIQQTMKPNSGWTYRFRELSADELGYLKSRQLMIAGKRICWCINGSRLESESCSLSVPSKYGHSLGLTEGFGCGSGPYSYKSVMGFSENDWEKLLDAWTPGPVLWEKVPLDERVRRLEKGKPCNPGYSAALVSKIAGMPLAGYFSHIKSLMEKSGKDFGEEETMRENMGGLSITYLEAARKIDKLLRDPFTRSDGQDSLWALASCLYIEHTLYKKNQKK